MKDLTYKEIEAYQLEHNCTKSTAVLKLQQKVVVVAPKAKKLKDGKE